MLRAGLIALPLVLAASAGILAMQLVLPGSDGVLGFIARSMVGGCGSLLTLVLVGRAVRRLMPLVVLLRLSLVFPDHAPSRLALALRAGNGRRLRDWADDHPDERDAQHHAEVVAGLVAALQAHDPRTRGHSERVRALTDLVATEMRLPTEEADLLRWGALLHDVGKLEVPASLLNKRGKPNPRELQMIRRHPAAGAHIANPLAAWFGEWRHAIDQHHEKYDGTGYPRSLAGNNIALSGRIVSVTDAFETMTAVRAYKRAMSVRDARTELVRCAGSHFDPAVVRSFLGISIGRLRWAIGPGALLAQIPLLDALLQAGAGAGSLLAGSLPAGLAGLVALVAPTGAAGAPPTTAGAASPPPVTATVPESASAPVVTAVSATTGPAPAADAPASPSGPPALSSSVAASVVETGQQVVDALAPPVTLPRLPLPLPELPALPGITPLP